MTRTEEIRSINEDLEDICRKAETTDENVRWLLADLCKVAGRMSALIARSEPRKQMSENGDTHE